MLRDRRGWALAAVVVAGGLIGAAISAAPVMAPAKALEAQQIARNHAIAAHDAGLLGPILADDISFSSHILHRQGRADVLATWTGLWKKRPDLGMRFQPKRTQVSASFNAAAETGTWTERWTEADGPVTLSGTYLTVWSRRATGAWQIAAETIAPLRCDGGGYCRR